MAIATIWVLAVSLAMPQALWLRVCLEWDGHLDQYKVSQGHGSGSMVGF